MSIFITEINVKKNLLSTPFLLLAQSPLLGWQVSTAPIVFNSASWYTGCHKRGQLQLEVKQELKKLTLLSDGETEPVQDSFDLIMS